jgi:hypothetical protein
MKYKIIAFFLSIYILSIQAMSEDVHPPYDIRKRRMFTMQALMVATRCLPLVDVRGSVGPGIIMGVVGSLYYVPDSQASVSAIVAAHVVLRTKFQIEQRIAAIEILDAQERQYFEGARLVATGMAPILPNNHWPQKAAYLDDAYNVIKDRAIDILDCAGNKRTTTIASVVEDITG